MFKIGFSTKIFIYSSNNSLVISNNSVSFHQFKNSRRFIVRVQKFTFISYDSLTVMGLKKLQLCTANIDLCKCVHAKYDKNPFQNW